ncbi:hypothetical protein [Sphingomonas turrisvirgatae]|uniref:Uncharacterized protein n=1 Tax=Sphingomonas turrisvirgatae TaxID=1888892 RepID=A0A1E3LWU0_9SPHN|nr:hypothetical protein [Sphingomonas turrisvirgatae]ODP38261.1 hypothetical protein BFL28_14900 [Sphingomonas turrisvirgatae]
MIALLLAPLAAAGMTAPAPPSTSVGLHQWRQLAGKRLRADKVVEDSRCPMNARCVWAGRTTVKVTLRDGARSRTANVTLGEAIPFAGGRLALVSVSPERMAGAQPRRPAPYRFTFQFRRD